MKFVVIVLLSFFAVVNLSNAEVSVKYLGNDLKYPGNPRLTDLLRSLAQGRDYYWLNAALFNLDSPEQNKKKRDVLSQLHLLKSNTGTKTSKWTALSLLENQIEHWEVALKLPIALDYDLIRIREEHDLRLDDGHYALKLPFRSNQVRIFGAVKEEIITSHIGSAHVKNYLNDLTLLEYADSEFLYIIQPNGGYRKVSLGVHDTNHVEVSPGGMIYIPIRELPFLGTNESLNHNIAMLAGSRLL